MDPFVKFRDPNPALVPDFMATLERVRASLHVEDWKALIKTNRVIKLWRFFLSLDPYTRWALVKPRGYAVDATLMDFAYGHTSVKHHIENSGKIGKEIYQYTSGAIQSRSARQRIDLLSEKVKMLAASKSKLTIMSFAAGHAREIETLPNATRSQIASFTAIDIDPESLQCASKSASNIKFVPIRKNVIKDEEIDALPKADLVYSLGLFDYLSEEYALKVLEKMWRRTGVRGQCIVANLAPDAGNLGYCEAIMDWWMVTRNAGEMNSISNNIAKSFNNLTSVEVSRHGCFYYLTLSST